MLTAILKKRERLPKNMDMFKDTVFIGEIVLQSKIAIRAAERLKATNNKVDCVEVWCSIQSILVASGNVSKILWPTYKKHEKRGERLRYLLKVEETNPLFDRKFRNHFEHYDSRIEDWFNNHGGAVFTDLAMNPSLHGTMFTESNHRGYNSFNNTLVFRGEILDLNQVLKALKDITENCRPYTFV